MNRLITLLLIVTVSFVTATAQETSSRKKAPTSPAAKQQPTSAMPLPDHYRDLLNSAEQMLLVTTPSWNSIDGFLQRYEKQNGSWQPVADKIPIVLAKNGLGWDAMLERPADNAPTKKEGDGRSPAGIFPITELFGFDASNPDAKLPYRQLTDSIECVDDANSSSYNKIVDRSEISHPDWDSSEKMRTIDVYKFGAVVGYNPLPSPGAGSCIFLHIWKGTGHGTAGCTAMNENQLKEVLDWLDGTKHPVIVQFPAAVYERLKSTWNLP